MNNPLRILQTLDRHLTAPAEMTIFDRAALALGYPGSPAEFATTRDVDAILPLGWLAAGDQNLDFWEAQQLTNAELEPEGLYVTHLFRELEIILTPSWLSGRVPLDLHLERLLTFRPSTLDLVLTKMARGDENDLADIQFLLRQEPPAVAELEATFQSARVPDVPEIQSLFRAAQPRVMALAASRQ